jgi:hypothetical protein
MLYNVVAPPPIESQTRSRHHHHHHYVMFIASNGYCVYSDQRQRRTKQHATDPELAERLWNISKEMCHL